MLQSFLNKLRTNIDSAFTQFWVIIHSLFVKPATFQPWMALLIPIWVVGSFFLSQYAAIFVLGGLKALGVSFANFNESVFQTVVSIIIYIVCIIVVIGVPWWVRKYRTSKAELGLAKPLMWIDLLLAPAGFVIYVILSPLLTSIAVHFPFYNAEQVQDTGFSQLSQGYEYILAFVTLVIIAPVCEEILFRGYLLGKLRKYIPIWAAVLITSVVFGILHLAWNVGVDVFALSLVLCTLRITTGRLWPSMLLHAIKNALAFYFLFINPPM